MGKPSGLTRSRRAIFQSPARNGADVEAPAVATRLGALTGRAVFQAPARGAEPATKRRRSGARRPAHRAGSSNQKHAERSGR